VLLHLVWAVGSEFENLLLEGPGVPCVIGLGSNHCFIDVLGAPVKVALQMLARTGHDWKIIWFHPFDTGVADLVAMRITVAGRLQPDCGARLLECPWATDNLCFGWRTVPSPNVGSIVCMRG